GVAALATEFKLEGPGNGWPGVYLFDEAALRAAIFDGLWWDPLTPLKTSVSAATLRAPVELQEAIAEPRDRVQVWSQYPHLVLRDAPFLFTSAHVAMIKSGSRTAEWRRLAGEFPPRLSVMERLVQAKKHLTGHARRDG